MDPMILETCASKRYECISLPEGVRRVFGKGKAKGTAKGKAKGKANGKDKGGNDCDSVSDATSVPCAAAMRSACRALVTAGSACGNRRAETCLIRND